LRIIYFVKRPLTKRDLLRYGINFFIKLGHQITVLDLSELVHPMLCNEQSSPSANRGFDLYVLKNWKELKLHQETIKNHDIAMFLIQTFGLSRSTYSALKYLSRSGTPYLILAPTLLPGLDLETKNRTLVAKVWDRVRELDRIDLLNSIIARIPPFLLGIRAAKYVVYNGLESQSPNNLIDSKTKPIYAHTTDFDQCIEYMSSNASSQQHVVFVDQALPKHPDARALGIKSIPDSKTYYADLCRSFSLTETALGLPVVIAAHPRATYKKNDKCFGGRDIIYGETVRLIAESKLVLTHFSSAIGMAVFLRKPIVIVTTPSLLKYDSNHRLIYKALNKLLDIPIWSLDHTEKFNFDTALNVNATRYDEYMNRYVKLTGSSTGNLWEIIETAISANQ
jgi:hypothetical protein